MAKIESLASQWYWQNSANGENKKANGNGVSEKINGNEKQRQQLLAESLASSSGNNEIVLQQKMAVAGEASISMKNDMA